MPDLYNPILQKNFSPRSPGIWQKFLLNCVSRLDSSSYLSRKLVRLAFGKELKHMRNVGANLELIPSDEANVWEIYWKKKHLGRTAPFPADLKGEDLWVLATGPSIKDLDLSKLQGRKILGLNGAIATCQEVGIAPSHYAITDRDFFEHRMPMVADAVNSGAHCFFSINGLARICEHAPHLISTGKISLLQTVNRYYGIPQLSSTEMVEALKKHPNLSISAHGDNKIGWSNDISNGVFTATTIAYIGCQIAESLEARNAFILGMDLGSTGSTPARSYESGHNARPTTIDKDYEQTILPAFELLSSITTSCKFWNLSPVSRLPKEIIPLKSYSESIEC